MEQQPVTRRTVAVLLYAVRLLFCCRGPKSRRGGVPGLSAAAAPEHSYKRCARPGDAFAAARCLLSKFCLVSMGSAARSAPLVALFGFHGRPAAHAWRRQQPSACHLRPPLPQACGANTVGLSSPAPRPAAPACQGDIHAAHSQTIECNACDAVMCVCPGLQLTKLIRGPFSLVSFGTYCCARLAARGSAHLRALLMWLGGLTLASMPN